MDADRGSDLLETLVVRRETVATLAAEDGVSVRDLEGHVDVSRATAHRVLTRLHEAGVVERTDGGYALTSFGDAVAVELATYADRVRIASEVRPLLAILARASVPFDLDWFADVTVTEATKGNPYAPIERVEALVAETSNEHVLNNGLVAPQRVLERARARAPDEVLGHTMVLDDPTLDRYREHYPAIIEESFECDHANAYVTEDVPLDLTLFDDRVVIPLFAQNTGAVSVLFDTDDPDAMAWGEAVFDNCRDGADPVDRTV